MFQILKRPQTPSDIYVTSGLVQVKAFGPVQVAWNGTININNDQK
jgi:hypothetical protein